MAGRKLELGRTGQTVAYNVGRLRKKIGLNYTELSERLKRFDRDIPPLGIRRVEQGDRRVDVDDLMALALALGTNPNALLFPPAAGGPATLTITESVMSPAWQVWKWASGERPLIPDVPDSVPEQNRGVYAQAFFESQTDPVQQDWTRAPNVSVVQAGSDGDDQ